MCFLSVYIEFFQIKFNERGYELEGLIEYFFINKSK